MEGFLGPPPSNRGIEVPLKEVGTEGREGRVAAVFVRFLFLERAGIRDIITRRGLGGTTK